MEFGDHHIYKEEGDVMSDGEMRSAIIDTTLSAAASRVEPAFA